MDIARFFDELDTIFPGDPQDTDPRDPSWAELASDVTGFTSPNELAVVNLAARLLPEDEAYLEVGTFKGRSLCAVVQGNPDKRFYAIENYMEFGMLGQEARAELTANLAKYAEGADVRLIEGDCFKVLARPGVIDRPIGVYFYDGPHTSLVHYLALGVIEPLLADEALVLVDDATWPMVQEAHQRYLSKHPGWTVEAKWDARVDDDPRWANGMHALAYRRPPGARRTLDPGVEWRRKLQVGVRGPAASVVWHTLHRFPKLVPLAKAVVPKRSRSVS